MPSRRCDYNNIVLPEDYEDLTPVTKFVAELARLMKIESDHPVPLSVVLDKHWHKIKYHMRDHTY